MALVGEPPLLRLASADGAWAAVVSARGAEVRSLTQRGVELLACVDGDACPLLFPAVGRQRAGAWRAAHDGEERGMPLHGFARESIFSCPLDAMIEENERCVLHLTSGDAGVARGAADAFPFPFRLAVSYALTARGLEATHTVTHVGAAGAPPMPFAIGAHPYLAVVDAGSSPTAAAAAWAGARVRGPTVRASLGLGPGSLLDGSATPVPAFSSPDGVALDAPGVTDGVFALHAPGAGEPSALALELPGRRTVTVTQRWDATPPSGVICDWAAVTARPLFVLWGAPPGVSGAPGGGGFLCVEPWVSGPDSLNTRDGLPVLAPGEAATWTWTLSA